MLSEAAGSSLPVTQQIAPSCSDSSDKGGRGGGVELFNQTVEGMENERREPGRFLPYIHKSTTRFVCKGFLKFLQTTS